MAQNEQNKKSAEERLEMIREAMREHYRLEKTDEDYRKKSDENRKIIKELMSPWEGSKK